MKKNGLFAGVMIVSAGKFILMAVNFLTTVILARLLVPRDFGVVAMCSVFLNVSNVLIDSGMAGSLVYQKDVEDIDKNTLFWFNIFVSVALYVILFFSAPVIASFYDTPILNTIIKIVGLSIVIHSTCFVQNALLMRDLRYKDQTLITIFSAVASVIVAIAMAYAGFGVWSLIAQTLSSNIVQVLLLFVFVRFIPHAKFSFKALKKHWNFGSKLLGSSILNIVYTNMYVQIIGKTVNVHTAGFYQQARKLNEFPRHLIQYPMDKVFFPYLVKSSDLRKDCFSLFKKTALFVIPVLFYLSLEAENIVKIVLGDKWMEASWMASLMFLGTIGASLESVNRSFIKASGNTGAILKNDLLKRVVNIVILLISLRWGVKGILVAFIVNGLVGWIMNSFVLCKIIGGKVSAQVGYVGLLLITSAASSALVLKFMPEYSSSVLTVIVHAVSFFGTCFLFLFPFFKEDFFSVAKKISRKVKR